MSTDHGTTSIDPAADLITLMNVFTVPADRRDELVALLDRATEEVMRHRPGFISANIHVGLDGTHVANYAQWASKEDFNAMLADPTCREHMGAASAIADAHPVMYRVHSVHH